MKHICPHCRQPAISNAALRWASRESPAQCGHCAGLSHVLASTSSGIGVLTGTAVAGSLALGVSLSSPWAGAAGVLVAVGCNVWMWRRCELFPIDARSAQTAHRVGWVTTLLATLVAFWG